MHAALPGLQNFNDFRSQVLANARDLLKNLRLPLRRLRLIVNRPHIHTQAAHGLRRALIREHAKPVLTLELEHIANLFKNPRNFLIFHGISLLSAKSLANHEVIRYTLAMTTLLEKLATLTAQKKKLQARRPLPAALVKNLEEWFKIELTYTSNAIEGNTLTRQETALVVEKGITVAGKSIKEHLEAVNHAEALEYIKGFVAKKRKDITEKDILGIHEIILAKIDETNAGRYRAVPVRIAGSTVILPNPLKVPMLMEEFMKWLHRKSKDHPVTLAGEAHFRFVSIHPFVDGNGRTARLLMNLLLMQAGYPPALIKKEHRLKYINAIERGQLYGEMEDYYGVIYEGVENSMQIYLKALEGKAVEKKRGAKIRHLLKIGELAAASGESVPTVRYWTKEGLLGVAEHTKGGYQLYEEAMVERVKRIRQLQREKRWTIQELREKLPRA